MTLDVWSLYRHMLRSRLFEEAVARLWRDGHISGEMHMSLGEEAIVAGVVLQLIDGDALALDHRGTAPLLMRGIDPVALLREFLGRPDGLCAGMGGHMHLFSPQHLAASSGIVGASGPAAVGFALAGQYLRPGTIAVAFFGEGAINQGMLMESMNLAVIWKLPVLFVCKDNAWAITTLSESVTGGQLTDRARGFGLPAIDVDGLDVRAVWQAASDAIARARRGDGPTFMRARCVHLEGHFLGDPLLRAARQPIREMLPRSGPLTRSLTRRKGAAVSERAGSLIGFMRRVRQSARHHLSRKDDPVAHVRAMLSSDEVRLHDLESKVSGEIQQAVERALT